MGRGEGPPDPAAPTMRLCSLRGEGRVGQQPSRPPRSADTAPRARSLVQPTGCWARSGAGENRKEASSMKVNVLTEITSTHNY